MSGAYLRSCFYFAVYRGYLLIYWTVTRSRGDIDWRTVQMAADRESGSQKTESQSSNDDVQDKKEEKNWRAAVALGNNFLTL